MFTEDQEPEVTEEVEESSRRSEAMADRQSAQDECTEELQQTKAQLLRLTADFQNYKHRVEKDRSQWRTAAKADLLLDLLPVVDDFDRALEEAKKEQDKEGLEEWIKGFSLIHKMLYDCLKRNDVVAIEQHETFDPELHEALVQVDSEDHQSGQIVQVMQRGFMMKDQVLRPSKVSVAK